MKSEVARSWIMETAPPQMIKVEKARRPISKFETILEDCVQEWMKPAAVMEYKKQSYESTLDTIWEETMQHVEGIVCEARGVMLRGGPVLGLNYWDQFCPSSADDGPLGSWGQDGV